VLVDELGKAVVDTQEETNHGWQIMSSCDFVLGVDESPPSPAGRCSGRPSGPG
jgi:hypothetical protein